MKKNNKQSSFKRLMTYVRPYRVAMVMSVVLLGIASVAYALAPFFMGISINSLTDLFTGKADPGIENTFIVFLILMAVGYVLKGILTLISNKLLIRATQNAVRDMRKEIDHKISKLPLNYYDTTTYGDILSRVTNDVDTISNNLLTSVSQVLAAIFQIACVLIMMIVISGWLTLLGIITVPVILFVASKISKKSQKEFNTQMDETGELNGYVEEYYNGHNIVTAFNRQQSVEENFEVTNDRLFKASSTGNFLSGLLYPFTQSMSNVSYILVACSGCLMAIGGGISIGMIQAFTQYLTQFATPLGMVMQTTPLIQSTNAAAARVFEFLDEEEEIPEAENPQFPEKLEGSVQFDHVRFGYVPHNTLIHDLVLDVKAGTKNAIVGPTGAGKTTLVNLIMRFYDVKGGAIRIDGVDIRDMKREDLRSIFGMVLQETWLYSGTIRENIRYGKLDATDEEVEAAAKAARADGFIRTLPGGYDFVLQEGAANIAQGQRQLLTIARAMLANAPILILDEATSSVDTRTEILIQEAMNNIMKGRTSFVIAHRLSTIKDANTILYMQDGDILEIGNHDELMAKNGLYAKLYNSQFADNNG